ncbi:phospholipase D-like domain-containing protein [Labilithrix luteola]|uniref:phospholipase D-like domain-containing protein n=1 Tax=Labilithrix luteola TaxID=1391654 RepID=UPI0011BADB41|nr:phospholipase D-like domain-containing protein [Labilithrix luteola]
MLRSTATLLSLICLTTLTALTPGCGAADDDAESSGDALSDLANAKAVLEIHPMDVWAQTLPSEGTTLVVTRGTRVAKFKMKSAVQVAFTNEGTYRVQLATPDHDAADLSFQFDGKNVTLANDDKMPAYARPALSISHDRRVIAGKSLPVHNAYVGLRHQWFSSTGRPARRDNDIELLMDGEQAWSTVSKDLRSAKKDIRVSTWWWESDFELTRSNDASLSADARYGNTILGLLEASPATKRILVGQFWGQDSILSFMTRDSKLKAHAEAGDDGFEFMGQANETSGKFHFKAEGFTFGDRVRAALPDSKSLRFDEEAPIDSTMPEKDVDLTQWPVGVDVEAASYHQKFMQIDSDLAYVGGMNLRRVDWDTSDHAVFNPKRMLFAASQNAREAVAAKSADSDIGPRKDYMVRIQGPAAQDVADVFHERWMGQLDAKVDYSKNATPFEVARDIDGVAGGHQIQITATLPQPFWEHSIGETWLNAVRHANEYIYIEDQYFRAPMLNEAIVQRMNEVPNLKLVVLTMPISEWTDPACAQTAIANELFASKFPDRYLRLQLQTFDTSIASFGIDETDAHFVQIDTHSKMLIVDDRFMSVGSANKNNRGMIYEAELNVAILDDAWVKSARHRILANILPSGTPETDDVATWWGQIKEAAAYNAKVRSAWDAEGMDLDLDGAPVPDGYVPRGFLYPLVTRTLSDCLLESVGPDMVDVPAVSKKHGAK